MGIKRFKQQKGIRLQLNRLQVFPEERSGDIALQIARLHREQKINDETYKALKVLNSNGLIKKLTSWGRSPVNGNMAAVRIKTLYLKLN